MDTARIVAAILFAVILALFIVRMRSRKKG
jgi:hypothetical protein